MPDGRPGAAPSMTLRVCALYPDLMNIYADRGNLLLLERRCRWRGIGFSVRPSGLGEALDPYRGDLYYRRRGRVFGFPVRPSGLGEELDPKGAVLYYIGGGQDRDQKLCALDLAAVKRDA